jgi:hypothetical protein
VRLADGTSGEVIALAVVQNCLSLFGILYHSAFTPIVPLELDVLTSAVDLEFYQPLPGNRSRCGRRSIFPWAMSTGVVT